MWQALHYEFMQHAVIAGIFVSIICGVIGTLVVVNRLVFMSGGIAHAAYGGIGLALYFDLPPTLCTAIFASVISIIMGAVTLKDRHRADTVIGTLWAMGMATGIIFVDLTPGYNVDLMSYLFGSILTITRTDLWLMAGINMAIISITLLFYKELVAISYDEDFVFTMGIPVTPFYFLFLLMTALTVVVSIKAVGLILVIALISIPPYIAENYTHSLSGMMVLSSLLGIFFTIGGLYLSYNYNLTSGASIIMVASASFFISRFVSYLSNR